MSTLRFSDGANFLELAVALAVALAETIPETVVDAYVTIQVQSAGFIGHNDVWICAKDVRVFCRALAVLDQTLRSEALLVSASPHELDLRIASADMLGHMVIFGSTGYHVSTSRRAYWHAVQLGFEFEPLAIATPWVQRNLVISKALDAPTQPPCREDLWGGALRSLGGRRCLSCFPTQHRPLPRQTPMITGDVASLANHAVTGNDKSQRIAADCGANRAGGLWTTELLGDIGIGRSLAEWNA